MHGRHDVIGLLSDQKLGAFLSTEFFFACCFFDNDDFNVNKPLFISLSCDQGILITDVCA